MARNSLEKTNVNSQILPETGTIGKCLDDKFLGFAPGDQQNGGILEKAPFTGFCWHLLLTHQASSLPSSLPERDETSTTFYPKERHLVSQSTPAAGPHPGSPQLPTLASPLLRPGSPRGGGLSPWYCRVCHLVNDPHTQGGCPPPGERPAPRCASNTG